MRWPGPSSARSITDRTLRRVALRICIVVAISSLIGFFHVRYGFEQQALVELGRYVEQRQIRESTPFELATEDLQAFVAEYEFRRPACLLPVVERDFRRLFVRSADGTYRTRSALFERRGITGYIGRHVNLTSAIKCRLVNAYDLLRQFGPAWRKRFVNLYVVAGENAVLMYWPELRWAIDANDWEIAAKTALVFGSEGGVAVSGPTSAARRSHERWSRLYFDYGINDWLVSATHDVVEDGHVVLTVGHDLLLKDLFERTLSPWREGSYNMIVDRTGRLIAHPQYMEAIQATSGALNVWDTTDDNLKQIYRRAFETSGKETIVESSDRSLYLAVTRLSGPEWFLITVFPKALVTSEAFKVARIILLLGLLVLLVELGILYRTMKHQVAKPLSRLTRAAERVAHGRYDSKLDTERSDELGTLARALTHMSAEVNARQDALNEQNLELANLSGQLRRELAERKRAEAELDRQRDALHQSEKLNALGSLLAGVAHELNNPLSVIVGRSYMLEEQLGDSPQARSVGKLRTAAERCVRIVKSFLAMARQQPHHRRATSIEEVLQGALDMVGYNLRQAGVAVEMSVPDTVPELHADADQLIQVFTNLLMNAEHVLRDSPEPRRVRLAVDVEELRQRLVVRVEDTGPGIAEGQLRRIFEPFFTTKPMGEGTGLGLSVSRGIVEAHGGTLRASNTAEGACFSVTLPLSEAIAAETVVTETQNGEGVSARVLLVEDEPEVAQTIVEVLGTSGHDVVVVASSRRALDLVCTDKEPFDLVLCDLHGSAIDGLALHDALRDQHEALPFIVMFGDSMNVELRHLAEKASVPILDKPFTPQELRECVSDALIETIETI